MSKMILLAACLLAVLTLNSCCKQTENLQQAQQQEKNDIKLMQITGRLARAQYEYAMRLVMRRRNGITNNADVEEVGRVCDSVVRGGAEYFTGTKDRPR